MTQPDLARLEGLLKPGEEQPWHEHDGSGRPHPPKSFVQIETRGGEKLALCSAFIRWPWVTPDDLEGYADDPDPASDVMRWRFAKEPPSSMVLAAFVPALLARVRELTGAIENIDCAAAVSHNGTEQRTLSYILEVTKGILDPDRATPTLNRSETDATR